MTPPTEGHLAALDLGGVRMKGVVLDASAGIVARAVVTVAGNPNEALDRMLRRLGERCGPRNPQIGAIVGSLAPRFGAALDLQPASPVLACYRGAIHLVPNAGGVLEIGGEHTIYLGLRPVSGAGPPVLHDVRLNTACSAGTGAFLEQEAHRLGLSLREFGTLAALSRGGLELAGRCAVFAKTDAVHRQQAGAPVSEIAGALCRTVARSAVSELIKGRRLDPPLVLVGGVAALRGIRRALRRTLRPLAVMVPRSALYASAIGAGLMARGTGSDGGCSLSEAKKRLGSLSPPPRPRALPSFLAGRPAETADPRRSASRATRDDGLLLGLDLGSTSTNAAVVSSSGRVLETCSVPTRGRAAEAARAVLTRIGAASDGRSPVAVGITGSGRHFLAALVGADLVINEITAHAAAAASFLPGADTVLDIGGQDSKYIRVLDGRVVGFAMNKTCSAGTGSFLEEMADQLELDVIGEFAAEAQRSRAPADLGDRCAVFVGAEARRRLREGSSRSDVAAGLAIAVARNYAALVIGGRSVGERICFQGGVAGNAAVVRAMETVLGRSLFVPTEHQAAGAIGAALLAGETPPAATIFRGFAALASAAVRTRTFSCRACASRCHVQEARTAEGVRFRAGALCDRHETSRERGAGRAGDAALRERMDAFGLAERHGTSRRTPSRTAPRAAPETSRDDGVGRAPIGMPRALLTHELHPFWSAFLGDCGVPCRLSAPTSRETIRRGIARCPSNACLPVRLAYGHCADLIASGVRTLLLPSVANLGLVTRVERLSHVCPAVQAWPFVARRVFRGEAEILAPRLHFAREDLLRKELATLGRLLGVHPEAARAAATSALARQEEAGRVLRLAGEHLLDRCDRSGEPFLVLLARPYLLFDAQIRLRLQPILEDLGLSVLTLDSLPGAPQTSSELDGMYWYSGKRILQTVRELRHRPNARTVHLSCFGCGSDSFLVHFLRRELAGRPLLELELDQHDDFTGIRTRLEAFTDGPARGRRPPRFAKESSSADARPAKEDSDSAGRGDARNDRRIRLDGRTLYVPRMSEHAVGLAAAFRSCGIRAEALAWPDAGSLALGRSVASGHECLPCALVVGDYLRQLTKSNGDSAAFFMVSGDGPCRLGQYPYLQRQALDAAGATAVPLIDASQDPAFYERLDGVAAKLKLRAWRSLAATDLLLARRRRLRPYAEDRARFDTGFDEALRELAVCVERDGDLPAALRRLSQRLQLLSKLVAPRRPIIGLVGENYVRCNHVANLDLADRLEDAGFEVVLPGLTGWIAYTNWTARNHCRLEGDAWRRRQLALVGWLQRWHASRLRRAIGRADGLAPEPSVQEILRRAARYLPSSLEGEVIVSLGRLMALWEDGAAGVIHVAPFGCLGGDVFAGLAESISEDLGGFPVLALEFDGRPAGENDARLEAFLLRVRLRSAHQEFQTCASWR